MGPSLEVLSWKRRAHNSKILQRSQQAQLTTSGLSARFTISFYRRGWSISLVLLPTLSGRGLRASICPSPPDAVSTGGEKLIGLSCSTLSDPLKDKESQNQMKTSQGTGTTDQYLL